MTADEALRSIAEQVCDESFYEAGEDEDGVEVGVLRADIAPADVLDAYTAHVANLCENIIALQEENAAMAQLRDELARFRERDAISTRLIEEAVVIYDRAKALAELYRQRGCLVDVNCESVGVAFLGALRGTP